MNSPVPESIDNVAPPVDVAGTLYDRVRFTGSVNAAVPVTTPVAFTGAPTVGVPATGAEGSAPADAGAAATTPMPTAMRAQDSRIASTLARGCPITCFTEAPTYRC